MNVISINDVRNLGRNLWQRNGIHGVYYRLFASGVTPNGCWLINPVMRELLDIDVASGKDVYGPNTLEFDGVTGTVPGSFGFVPEVQS
jgi:hypothetical protein